MSIANLSRVIGRQICTMKGCRYFFPNGCINSWSAYACIRCGKLDRPIEDLPPAPAYEDDDYSYADEHCEFYEHEYRCACRWFAPLPWPRWA